MLRIGFLNDKGLLSHAFFLTCNVVSVKVGLAGCGLSVRLRPFHGFRVSRRDMNYACRTLKFRPSGMMTHFLTPPRGTGLFCSLPIVLSVASAPIATGSEGHQEGRADCRPGACREAPGPVTKTGTSIALGSHSGQVSRRTSVGWGSGAPRRGPAAKSREAQLPTCKTDGGSDRESAYYRL